MDTPVTDLNQAATTTEGEACTGPDCTSPNRLARRLFVYVSMAVAWATSVVLTAYGGESKLAHLVADSMCTYNITMGVTYIVGHSVDRSQILDKLFTRPKE